MNTTVACVRGCGTRSTGGTYLCFPVGPGGRPIETFLIDPVKLWPGDFQRGFKIVRNKSGHNDVVIFVGEGFYVSFWDFVEEARRFGISRKVAPTFPFHELTPGLSSMIFVHSKARPNFPYTVDAEYPRKWCQIREHEESPCVYEMRDLSFVLHPEAKVSDDCFQIEMPSFSYTGRLPRVAKAIDLAMGFEWSVGGFMKVPLTHIEFPRRLNVKSAQAANKAGFQTIVTEW